MQRFPQIVVSILCGFAGGIAAFAMAAHLWPTGGDREIFAETIRATRFELVGPAHHSTAYWGPDEQGRSVALVFKDPKGQPRAEFGVTSSGGGSGTSGLDPQFALSDENGKRRLQGFLDGGRPLLLMGGSQTENRLILGRLSSHTDDGESIPDRDVWMLIMRDPYHNGWQEYVSLGASNSADSNMRGGFVVVRDSSGKASRFP